MKTKQIINSILVSCLAGAFALACNHLEQKSNPVPQPDKNALPLILQTTASGEAPITLAALGISRTAAFSIKAEGFKYGAVIFTSDSTLAYRAASATNWPADSGRLNVCQGGACAIRTIRVLNSSFIPPQSMTTTDLGLVRSLQIGTLANTLLQGLPGTAEAGAKIDSIWGYLHLASIKPDSITLDYASVGGIAYNINIGWDQLHYRVKRPSNMGFYLGRVDFSIPDSCLYPNARGETFTSSPGSGSIAIFKAPLFANDLSCTGVAPLRPHAGLTMASYLGFKTIATKYGTVKDTVYNANDSCFVYRRTVPSAVADTFYYYLREGDDDRVTRAQIIVNTP